MNTKILEKIHFASRSPKFWLGIVCGREHIPMAESAWVVGKNFRMQIAFCSSASSSAAAIHKSKSDLFNRSKGNMDQNFRFVESECTKALFSSPQKPKSFQDSLSHRIFRHIHEVLNIDENKN